MAQRASGIARRAEQPCLKRRRRTALTKESMTSSRRIRRATSVDTTSMTQLTSSAMFGCTSVAMRRRAKAGRGGQRRVGRLTKLGKPRHPDPPLMPTPALEVINWSTLLPRQNPKRGTTLPPVAPRAQDSRVILPTDRNRLVQHLQPLKDRYRQGAHL